VIRVTCVILRFIASILWYKLSFWHFRICLTIFGLDILGDFQHVPSAFRWLAAYLLIVSFTFQPFSWNDLMVFLALLTWLEIYDILRRETNKTKQDFPNHFFEIFVGNFPKYLRKIGAWQRYQNFLLLC